MKKLLLIVLSLLCFCSFKAVQTNDIKLQSRGFEVVGNKWQTVVSAPDKRDEIKFDKNYFWAGDKGTYRAGEAISWYFAYKYYNEQEDVLYYYIGSYLKMTPLLDDKLHFPLGNMSARQIIKVSGLPFENISYFPKNINNTHSYSMSLGGTIGSSDAEVSVSISNNFTYYDLELTTKNYVEYENSSVLDVYYQFSNYDNNFDGIHGGTVEFLCVSLIAINDPGRYYAKEINISFQNETNFYLDGTGLENYKIYSNNYPNNRIRKDFPVRVTW